MIQQTSIVRKHNPYIGLSLSKCIKDLITSDIDLEDVLVIVTGTRAEIGTDTWRSMISDYCSKWWRLDPIKAQLIVDELVRDGKIVQPRLTDNDGFYRLDTHDGHWIRLEQG